MLQHAKSKGEKTSWYELWGMSLVYEERGTYFILCLDPWMASHLTLGWTVERTGHLMGVARCNPIPSDRSYNINTSLDKKWHPVTFHIPANILWIYKEDQIETNVDSSSEYTALVLWLGRGRALQGTSPNLKSWLLYSRQASTLR